MAKELGAFERYEANSSHMLRVIRNHRRAAYGHTDGYEDLDINPVPLDHESCKDKALINHAVEAWDKALELGQQYGYRNAQTTVVAPTHGTIGLVMDCDTTGNRAGLRSGQIQETCWWRLLQDHQPYRS